MFQSRQNLTQITFEYGVTFEKHCCRCKNMTYVHFQHVAQRLSQEKGGENGQWGNKCDEMKTNMYFPVLWVMMHAAGHDPEVE